MRNQRVINAMQAMFADLIIPTKPWLSVARVPVPALVPSRWREQRYGDTRWSRAARVAPIRTKY